MKKFSLFFFLPAFLFLSHPVNLWAHGIVGQRFFPATIVVDDPFVADEMDLLAYSNIKAPDPNDSTKNSLFQTFWTGISKRLTRDFGISLAVVYDQQNSFGSVVNGFENLNVNMKYVIFKSPLHEFIIASGLGFSIGGTGTKNLSSGNATSYTTVTPNLYFGYGFGNLPDSLMYLRPFAVTGVVGMGVPVTDGNGGAIDYSASLNYAFTIQYSTMYLQSFVKDIGLPKPFSRTIPVVEFVNAKSLNGPNQYSTNSGKSFVYPGFIWIGKYWELGVEAVIPRNINSGSETGFQVLAHLFLDDIAPDIFTRTLSGEVLGPPQYAPPK